MSDLPAHSKLGASGAERWMNCPGSVALLSKLTLPETDEPDYRKEGVAAHAAAAHCLENRIDAWEIIGEKFHDTPVDAVMANAIQVYLDICNEQRKDGGTFGIEDRFHYPELHAAYFGTIDWWRYFEGLLEVTDYKHGVGIAVDIEWNPQLMYYAYAKLQDYPETRLVRMRIVQPRGFHPDGPVRTWEISAENLCQWAEETLLPAMKACETDNTLDAGPWCRFCPAKLVCPLMDSLFGAAAKANPKAVIDLTSESLGRSYQYTQAVKFYLKAMEDETYRRLNLGQAVPGTKLVLKKANRVYKAGAEEIVKARFGEEAYSKPELKSPAEIEKLGPEASAIVKEWCFTPQTGYTVALETDKRPAVKVQTTEEAFGKAVEAAVG